MGSTFPGIGPARKRALLLHFGTAGKVRAASLQDLQRAPGVSAAVAQAVYASSCLPGVYEPWRFMKPLSDLLHAEGYHVYVIAGLGYNTGRVPAMARIVRGQVLSLREREFVDAASGRRTPVGRPGLMGEFGPSPNGEYVLVARLKRQPSMMLA